MTEPFPSTQTPQESLAYQPISPWAIAGVVSGGFFTVLVVVSTVVALYQNVPVFLPVWLLGFAVLGIVLSLIGQQQIQNSEGTRAGATLARIGLWLSLFSGSGYFSFYYITGLALQNQANAFVMDMGEDSGFFPRLRDGGTNPAKLNSAFLLTLPANQRSGRPDDDLGMHSYHDTPTKDGNPGNLSDFKNSPFVRVVFGQDAKDVEITPLTVLDWRHEKRSYKIQRQYGVKTKEVDAVFLVTVQSTEAVSAGENRKWFVNFRESDIQTKDLILTPFGKGIQLLRTQSRDMLESWAEALNKGQSFAAYKNRDQTPWNRLFMQQNKERARKAITRLFTGDEKNRLVEFAVTTRKNDIGKWEQVEGRIRIYHPFRFTLIEPELGFPTVHAYAVLETKQAIDPAKFDHDSAKPEWDITGVVVTNVIPKPLPRPQQ